MSIVTVGIDLAKNVFAVHGVDQNGKAALIKLKVPREQLLPLIAQLPPCLIGVESCSGAPLGEAVPRVGLHGQTKASQVRHAAAHGRQTWQARCSGSSRVARQVLADDVR